MNTEFGFSPEVGDDRAGPYWREPFEWQEPAEWQEADNLVSLVNILLEDKRLEAAEWLLYNRRRAEELYGWEKALHTPPAAEHYRHTYLWDSGFAAIMLSRAGEHAARAADFLGSRLPTAGGEHQGIMAAVDQLREKSRTYLRAAVEESFWVVNKQKEDGFIAGTQYAEGWLWYEVEKAMSLDRKDKSTHYSQPPILPLAALSTFKALKETGNPGSDVYLEGIYRYMDKFMHFFQNKRRNGPDDPLIGVIDGHETGWDSATRWDHKKPERRPRSGPDTPQEIDEHNMIIDGTLAVMRQFDRFVWARNNPEKQRRVFWENDVFMNAVYFHNLQAMIQLSDELAARTGQTIYDKRAGDYRLIAEELQSAMLEKMWFDNSDEVPQKGFYNLKANGEPNPDISPNNIFGLLLPRLSEGQLKSILAMMDEHFDVEYPLPSTSTKGPSYDPHNQEKHRLWRGPTWINVNYYLVEFGLLMHADRTDISDTTRYRCLSWAKRIVNQSNKLLDINKPPPGSDAVSEAYEHYDSELGSGQRPSVKNFVWSWLARFMTPASEMKKRPASNEPLT